MSHFRTTKWYRIPCPQRAIPRIIGSRLLEFSAFILKFAQQTQFMKQETNTIFSFLFLLALTSASAQSYTSPLNVTPALSANFGGYGATTSIRESISRQNRQSTSLYWPSTTGIYRE